MADLDAELLALAGEESDEEPSGPTQEPAAESSPEPEDASRSKSRGRPGKSKGGRRGGSLDDEVMSGTDEEVAMSESEGEAPEESEIVNKYPIENKFKSEQDRAEIMALPEIQREQILADRADETGKQEEQRALKALFSSYKSSTGEKKRKASESDLRGERKSARQKTTPAAKPRDAHLEELRRRREEKGAQRAAQPSKTRRSESIEADAEGESDVEWEERRREETPEEEPTVLRDFERIKVNRNNFAKVCFYPGFAETMIGCYVKVTVGKDRASGELKYRMARIEGITEKVPYAVEGANNRLFITTQHIIVSIGTSKRDAPFIHCSTRPIEQHELDFYLATLKKDNLPLPKKSRLIAKIADINRLNSHSFTAQELQAKLDGSSNLQKRYRQRESHRLETQLTEALEAHEAEKAARIKSQIENVLKAPLKLHYDTKMDQGRPTGATPSKPEQLTQQQRLARLNEQNRKADTERIRKALLAEKRAAAGPRKLVAEHREAPNGKAVSGTGPNPSVTDADKARMLRRAAEVRMINGKPCHNLFYEGEDLELPRPGWCFNYVEYSNKYLGSRSLRHLTYDDKGRAITEIPREMCDDEVIARMDIPLRSIVEE